MNEDNKNFLEGMSQEGLELLDKVLDEPDADGM